MSTQMLNDHATGRPFGRRGLMQSGAALSSDSAGSVIKMLIADQLYPTGSRVAVKCTVAGNVQLTFEDGSSDTFPVNVGLTLLPFRVTEWNAAGTTATATFSNLI